MDEKEEVLMLKESVKRLSASMAKYCEVTTKAIDEHHRAIAMIFTRVMELEAQVDRTKLN